MPFQQINFAAIPPMGRPALEDALSTFMKGYAASQVPAQLRRQAQAAQIANAMAQLKLQQEPQAFGADMQAKQLANAFQSMQNQEQPQKFSSDMASAAANRGLIGANTNKINTLLPYDVRRGELATNPNAKFNFMNTLVNLLTKGPDGAQNNAPANAPAAVTSPMRASDNLQITPEAAKNLANAGVAQDAPPGYTSNAWNQMMRPGLGFPAQTPAEKAAQQLQLFQAKQDYKRSQPTQKLLSQNQLSLQAVDNVMPVLDDLKNMAAGGKIPGQLVGKYLPWNTDAQAAYLSKIGTAKDTLIKGLGLNPTDSIVTLMNEIAGMQPRESSGAYVKKLEQLKTELKRRRQSYVGASQNPYPAAQSGNTSEVHDPLGLR